MSYFLCDGELAPGSRVSLEGEEARHARASRRLRVGEALYIQDARGQRFRALVESRERRSLSVRVDAAVAIPPLPEPQLTLIQAAVKAKAAETIVQKATELGVARVIFFLAEWGTVPARELGERARDRWQRIAWEACKQSDRGSPPALEFVESLEAALAQTAEADLGWVFHPEPDGGGSAQTAALPATGVSRPEAARVVIGPEGGLTDAEVARCRQAGCEPVSLPGPILRADTAALAACVLLLHGRPR